MQKISLKKTRFTNILEYVLLFIGANTFISQYNLIAYISSLEDRDFGPFLLTHFDLLIPYSPFLFFVYIFYYIFLQFDVLIFIANKCDVKPMRRILCGMFFLYLCGFIIYLILPTSIYSLMESVNNILCFQENSLINYFNRSITTAFAANPSLHVGSAWLMLRSLYRFYPHNRRRQPILVFSNIFFILLVISVVTLKYHFVIDVLSGFILAELVYLFVVQKDCFKTADWDKILGIKKLLIYEGIVALSLTLLLILSMQIYMNSHGIWKHMC